MESNLKKIIRVSSVVLVFCSFGALTKLWSGVAQIFWTFLPIFGKQYMENYFTSMYFIAEAIMAIVLGFDLKVGKTLFKVVSIIM